MRIRSAPHPGPFSSVLVWFKWDVYTVTPQAARSYHSLRPRAPMCVRLHPRACSEVANVALDLLRDEAILHEELKYVVGTFVSTAHGYARRLCHRALCHACRADTTRGHPGRRRTSSQHEPLPGATHCGAATRAAWGLPFASTRPVHGTRPYPSAASPRATRRTCNKAPTRSCIKLENVI